MIAGRGTPDQLPARMFAYRHPEALRSSSIVLVEASADYLVRQFEAGADAVQIFDTWAGILPADEFGKWCIDPIARIVAKVRSRIPAARIIGFPRGAGNKTRTISCGRCRSMRSGSIGWWSVGFARDQVQKRRPVQGNLDPLALLAGGDALDRAVDAILEAFAEGPFIFNLGHGMLPDTPVAHVERMVERVRRA